MTMQQSSKLEAYLTTQRSNFLPYDNHHPHTPRQNKKHKQNQEKSKQETSYLEYFCLIHILFYQILSV